LLLITALKCVINKAQENKETLELSGTHQLMLFADGIHLLAENTTKKNTESPLRGGKRSAGLL
jgi:hypothetical protein